MEAGLWYGIVAPRGTPKAVVGKLNAAMTEILKEPDILQSMQKQSFEPEPGPADGVTTRIKSEIERWRTLIAKTGIKAE